MPANMLDRFLEYSNNIGKRAVRYHSAMTGRPIIYCSLKTTSATVLEDGTVVETNKAITTLKDDESLAKWNDERKTIKSTKDVLKNLYPETVYLEPQAGITSYLDSLTGMNRVEINEDYNYYKLYANIIKTNQTTSAYRFDPTMQILLPKYEGIDYKKNDKVIFSYEDKEYIYTVIEGPETYLGDVYQLNLKAVYSRNA